MSFPILVSHMGSIETITIPTVYQIPIFAPYIFHRIVGGYQLYKIKIKDYEDHSRFFSTQGYVKNFKMMKY